MHEQLVPVPVWGIAVHDGVEAIFDASLAVHDARMAVFDGGIGVFDAWLGVLNIKMPINLIGMLEIKKIGRYPALWGRRGFPINRDLNLSVL